MKGRQILVCVLALGLLLALAVGLSQAQGPAPPERNVEEETGVAAPKEAVHDVIDIQGQLADASGNPLSGTYDITARIYDAETGTLRCWDTDSKTISNGLFIMHLDGTDGCTSWDINGDALDLGIEVESDGEMDPRQGIYPVPYAWSLRPGAVIAGDVAGDSVLQVHNGSTSNGSKGVYGRAYSLTGTTYGVYGESYSADGYGGYFASTTLPPGGGVALKAAGSGIIQSTANSYLWISGNSLQKANSDDTTRWQYDDYGGYKVYAGSDWVNLKRVVLPVTIPGQLYGQNVTVTGMDLYYAIDGEFTVIDAVFVRRQDGVGTGDLILFDDTDLTCGAGEQCSMHWDVDQNNVLSDQQGVLHIVLRFAFGGEVQYIQIGGVRLTLEHD